jgi:hypothetical protein
VQNAQFMLIDNEMQKLCHLVTNETDSQKMMELTQSLNQALQERREPLRLCRLAVEEDTPESSMCRRAYFSAGGGGQPIQRAPL